MTDQRHEEHVARLEQGLASTNNGIVAVLRQPEYPGRNARLATLREEAETLDYAIARLKELPLLLATRRAWTALQDDGFDPHDGRANNRVIAALNDLDAAEYGPGATK